jgi:hypothetical protein
MAKKKKSGILFPSGLEKTLCKWGNICPSGHERVKRLPVPEFNKQPPNKVV